MWTGTGGVAASTPRETIKNMQRSDPTAKAQWCAYCDQFGDGHRDPHKHDDNFVTTFLDQYNQGHRIEVSVSASLSGGSGSASLSGGSSLKDLIKEGQRKSSNWKQAWQMYCQTYGGGINDPAKHDEKYLIGFIDHVGQCASGGSMMGGMDGVSGWGAMGGGGLGMWGPSAGGGPLKRPRIEAKGGGKGGSGDPIKDALVERIKAYQRTSQDQKEQWWQFCATNSADVRDPNRHDTSTLQTFCNSMGVP